MSARIAGRKLENNAAFSATSVRTIHAGASSTIAAPARRVVTMRSRSPTTSTRSRGYRSAIAPATGEAIAAGNSRTKAATPTSPVPPCSKAYTSTATVYPQ